MRRYYWIQLNKNTMFILYSRIKKAASANLSMSSLYKEAVFGSQTSRVEGCGRHFLHILPTFALGPKEILSISLNLTQGRLCYSEASGPRRGHTDVNNTHSHRTFSIPHNQVSFIHKENEMLLFSGKHMELEDTILSEISQSQKDQKCMFFFSYKKKKKNFLPDNTSRTRNS